MLHSKGLKSKQLPCVTEDSKGANSKQLRSKAARPGTKMGGAKMGSKMGKKMASGRSKQASKMGGASKTLGGASKMGAVEKGKPTFGKPGAVEKGKSTFGKMTTWVSTKAASAKAYLKSGGSNNMEINNINSTRTTVTNVAVNLLEDDGASNTSSRDGSGAETQELDSDSESSDTDSNAKKWNNTEKAGIVGGIILVVCIVTALIGTVVLLNRTSEVQPPDDSGTAGDPAGDTNSATSTPNGTTGNLPLTSDDVLTFKLRAPGSKSDQTLPFTSEDLAKLLSDAKLTVADWRKKLFAQNEKCKTLVLTMLKAMFPGADFGDRVDTNLSEFLVDAKLKVLNFVIPDGPGKSVGKSVVLEETTVLKPEDVKTGRWEFTDLITSDFNSSTNLAVEAVKSKILKYLLKMRVDVDPTQTVEVKLTGKEAATFKTELEGGVTTVTPTFSVGEVKKKVLALPSVSIALKEGYTLQFVSADGKKKFKGLEEGGEQLTKAEFESGKWEKIKKTSLTGKENEAQKEGGQTTPQGAQQGALGSQTPGGQQQQQQGAVQQPGDNGLGTAPKNAGSELIATEGGKLTVWRFNEATVEVSLESKEGSSELKMTVDDFYSQLESKHGFKKDKDLLLNLLEDLEISEIDKFDVYDKLYREFAGGKKVEGGGKKTKNLFWVPREKVMMASFFYADSQKERAGPVYFINEVQTADSGKAESVLKKGDKIRQAISKQALGSAASGFGDDFFIFDSDSGIVKADTVLDKASQKHLVVVPGNLALKVSGTIKVDGLGLPVDPIPLPPVKKETSGSTTEDPTFSRISTAEELLNLIFQKIVSQSQSQGAKSVTEADLALFTFDDAEAPLSGADPIGTRKSFQVAHTQHEVALVGKERVLLTGRALHGKTVGDLIMKCYKSADGSFLYKSADGSGLEIDKLVLQYHDGAEPFDKGTKLEGILTNTKVLDTGEGGKFKIVEKKEETAIVGDLGGGGPAGEGGAANGVGGGQPAVDLGGPVDGATLLLGPNVDEIQSLASSSATNGAAKPTVVRIESTNFTNKYQGACYYIFLCLVFPIILALGVFLLLPSETESDDSDASPPAGTAGIVVGVLLLVLVALLLCCITSHYFYEAQFKQGDEKRGIGELCTPSDMYIRCHWLSEKFQFEVNKKKVCVPPRLEVNDFSMPTGEAKFNVYRMVLFILCFVSLVYLVLDVLKKAGVEVPIEMSPLFSLLAMIVFWCVVAQFRFFLVKEGRTNLDYLHKNSFSNFCECKWVEVHACCLVSIIIVGFFLLIVSLSLPRHSPDIDCALGVSIALNMLISAWIFLLHCAALRPQRGTNEKNFIGEKKDNLTT